MTGKIMPETNCAPNEALYSDSLRSSKRSRLSASRPNTLTSSWPEKDSSICPFRAPVDFHCSLNSPCARAPITPAATPESGSAISAIRAICQDTMNIMMTMPTTCSTDWTSWANACCRASGCCRRRW